MTLIAQLTDLHVGPGEQWAENRQRLDDAVDSLNAEDKKPDVVLGTGDLVNTGTAEEFEALRSSIDRLELPFLALPGNHDDRAVIRAAFPDTPWIDEKHGHASWALEVGQVTVIGLDTTAPMTPGGVLDEPRINWLTSEILNATSPILLALHHPPFRVGIWWMDELGFVGLDLLDKALTDHPVERIIAGHYHRPIQSSIAGVPATVGLATAPHVHLDLDPECRPAIIDEPYGYQLHLWTGSGFVSHTRYVDIQSSPTYFDL